MVNRHAFHSHESFRASCPALCDTAAQNGVCLSQTVSVAVSVLTLTFISIERWYAICFPLQFRSTISRAKRAIALIWVVALLFDVPELVVLHTEQKELGVDSVLLTQCISSWNRQADMIYHCIKSAVLYFVPLGFMLIAYLQIARVLWDEEHFPVHQPGKFPQEQWQKTNISKATYFRSTISLFDSNTIQQKAAKMLVAVVALFAVCYLPVHLLSILRPKISHFCFPRRNGRLRPLSLLRHYGCQTDESAHRTTDSARYG
ncbi:hypothetical protein FOCC_FOCC005863 [Frankliniella occidentalis]|nr:hypothetical protein FOCC_FOCC005863 [Frankliniella occidentalis]